MPRLHKKRSTKKRSTTSNRRRSTVRGSSRHVSFVNQQKFPYFKSRAPANIGIRMRNERPAIHPIPYMARDPMLNVPRNNNVHVYNYEIPLVPSMIPATPRNEREWYMLPMHEIRVSARHPLKRPIDFNKPILVLNGKDIFQSEQDVQKIRRTGINPNSGFQAQLPEWKMPAPIVVR